MPYAVGSVRDIPVRALKLCGLTWSGEFLWFSESVLKQIMAVDPHTGAIEHRLDCADVRTDLTTLGGNLVQVAGERRDLRVIHPQTGAVLGEHPNPRPGNTLCGLEATRDGLWLGYEDLRVIDLRSPVDFTLIDTFRVERGVAGVTVSDGYLVYADYRSGLINLVDIDSGREVAAYWVHGNPTGLTWDGRRIWYCDYATFQLRAIEVPGILKG
ncbi:hypothetical protein [Saccharopolyspora sp. CA-218241]|uniref:hypothetical protein n=1 Tax=Saccharopolyspora sp. CA-218241 TaxID=3240027 RepID=UPI003D98DEE3